MPLSISIICPVYNSEKYLDECILSVLEQTDGNWELLLIDDGSTDQSGFICDRFSKSDSRIKVFHKTNGGQMQARIEGIKRSSCDYIIFLDSDDLLEKDSVHIVRRNIQLFPIMDALLFNAEIFPKHKNNKELPIVLRNLDLQNNHDIIQYSFCSQMFGYLWMYCFKKTLLLKSIEKNNSFVNIRYTEDGSFIYNVLSSTEKMRVICNTLYCYRDNSESITHNITTKDRIDRFYVFNHIFEDIFRNHRILSISNDVTSMLSWAMFSMLNHINDKKEFKEMFKKARKSVLFTRICKKSKVSNRQFRFYKLLLTINCSFLYYKFSHK